MEGKTQEGSIGMRMSCCNDETKEWMLYDKDEICIRRTGYYSARYSLSAVTYRV
jgi:hypothetical protein